ncbi:hypothetical protein BC828DRAFT_371993 [Blastocladiella britannica]|nr:hypothetical protein BC828DRAFT_371993 [Blastocladiella britannica]
MNDSDSALQQSQRKKKDMLPAVPRSYRLAVGAVEADKGPKTTTATATITELSPIVSHSSGHAHASSSTSTSTGAMSTATVLKHGHNVAHRNVGENNSTRGDDHRVDRSHRASATSATHSAMHRVLHNPHILHRILRHAGRPTAHAALRVSKAFAGPAARVAWATAIFHNFHGFLGLLQLSKVLARRPGYGTLIQHLAVHYSGAQVGGAADLALDRPLVAAVMRAPALRRLTLHIHDASKLTPAAVRQALAAAPMLTDLDLAWAPAVVLDPVFLSLPPRALSQLVSLTVGGGALSDNALAYIANGLTLKLRSLALRADPVLGPRLLSWRGIAAAIARHAGSLERLEIKGVPMTEPIAELPPLPRLAVLHLTFLASRSAVDGRTGTLALVRAAHASGTRALAKLVLIGAPVEDITEMAPLLGPSLTALEILHAPSMSVAACEVLATHLTLLRQFRLVASPLTDRGLKALCGGDSKSGGCLGEVRDLDWQAVNLVTESAVLELAAAGSLQKLRWIRIIDCNEIGDNAVAALCRSSPTIETVHAVGPRMTQSIYWLAIPHLRDAAWVVIANSDNGAGAHLATDAWNRLVETLPAVACAVHDGWLLTAQGVATAAPTQHVPGANSTGTTYATVAGSPYVPVLTTPAATHAVARAARAAVGSAGNTVGVRLGVVRDGPSFSTKDAHGTNDGEFDAEELDHLTERLRRIELYRPRVEASQVMLPNLHNPYVMQQVP